MHTWPRAQSACTPQALPGPALTDDPEQPQRTVTTAKNNNKIIFTGVILILLSLGITPKSDC
jgi:hypothetical protein